ncbi:L-aspartate oxidase [Francisella frigiditurris]|uniref:L-aspartate oxidase n=1 Tax=Francisella frigiditurris TaxID=1542390 RepID=A0A1J0KUC4_9GAMM|nr:L-aspartate oxidase [Francisella frigiditurris]APC97298.1 L-aspartate oxidase [Francisella frigiditurris]
MITKKHDVVIVGSGLAGVATATELLSQGFDVALLCDKDIGISASFYAQGGIAAVVSEKDSIDLHTKDTMVASGNAAELDSVKYVVGNSFKAIKWLEKKGVVFDREEGKYSLHLEGGHSLGRVLHIKDYTGKAIQTTLLEKIVGHEKLTVYKQSSAFRIFKKDNKCAGIYAYNGNAILKIFSKNIVLATGGASGIYKYSTNAYAFIGSGMIMAHDAGCKLKNLEFTQFHPTCFFDKHGEPLLISEAIRGNGAKLELESGYRIMQSIHKLEDLAPRDIVARQIYVNMQKGHTIYLNATHMNKTEWEDRFPFIYQRLLENNINPVKDRIPIAPAAHYSCGGIEVNGKSQTAIEGLYAIGECSYTGLHGANRLASNSLLECIVYALAASKDIIDKPLSSDDSSSDINEEIMLCNMNFDISKYVQEIKQIMWDKVGLVRKKAKLLEAQEEINAIYNKVEKNISVTSFDSKLNFLFKLVSIAKLTVESALKRESSIGSHYLD